MVNTTAAKTSQRRSSSTTSEKKHTAARSIASSKPGKSGASQHQDKRKAGGLTSHRVIPPATIKQMKDLQHLGIAMTNIHRIVKKKHKDLRYYDVWKVLHDL